MDDGAAKDVEPRHITSEALSPGAVRACWVFSVVLLAAGIIATFTVGGGAAAASMILLGTLLLVIALMRRVPLNIEVAGAKLDASYREDRAFEAGREGGLQAGVESAISEIEEAAERGEPPEKIIKHLKHRWEPLSPVAVTTSETAGYPAPVACQVAGVTYRQLDYWVRTGLVTPRLMLRDERLFTARDILEVRVIKRLLDTGVSLQQIRVAIAHLRELDESVLRRVTLLSDGQMVRTVTSPDEVIEVVSAGHGVFGIAVGRLAVEMDRQLAKHRDDELGPMAPPE